MRGIMGRVSAYSVQIICCIMSFNEVIQVRCETSSMDNPNERVELTEEELDDLAEKEYLEYLESIGAIREDGTIDRSKIKYQPEQTIEELEALLWKKGDDHTDG